MNDEVRKVKCPECGNLTEYKSENKFRPFCSERCKLIDLGQWASENYKIPIEKNSIHSEDEIDTEDYTSDYPSEEN